MGGGKGLGNFDVQSTLGATLPTGNPAITTAGRPVAWNTVAQYRIGKLFWPEVESNATFYKGGTNDGKMQEFLTPGLIVGKCALHPSDPKSRPGLAVGAGMQIAASHFHAFNHGLVSRRGGSSDFLTHECLIRSASGLRPLKTPLMRRFARTCKPSRTKHARCGSHAISILRSCRPPG